jgi:WD40 repeat protein
VLAALLLAIGIAGPLVALYQRSLRRQAEQAQQSLEITLADTYTSFGLAAGQRGDRAQAVLWFAHAASLAPFDRQRAEASRVRVRAWSRETPIPVRALVHEGQQLRELLPHAGGRYLLVLAFDEKLTLWDLESEQPVALPEISPCVSAAAWSRDGKYLAAGTSEGEVRLLEFPSGRCAERILHPGPISALAFSPDGQYLALASDRARVWSCAERRWATGEMLHPGAVTVSHLSFSSGGDRLAIAWGSDEASVFSVSGQPEQLEPRLKPVPHLHQVPPGLFANGRVLLTVDGSGGLALWDVDTGKKISAAPSTVGGAGDIRALQISPNGRYVVVCGYPNAQVYRVDDPDNPAALTACRTIQHLNRVVAADFSPDSRMVLTASIDRTARLSRSDLTPPVRGSPEGDEGPLPERTILHQDEVILAAYSPDRRSFVTAQADGLVRVWAACSAEGRRVPLPAAESYVTLTPDGRSVVPSGWRSQRGLSTVQMYQLATGKAVGPALRPGGLVNAALVSPDGRQMIILSSLEENEHRRAWPDLQLDRHPGWISFWDLTSTQSRAAPRRTPSEPMGGAFSPDGRLAAVVCARGEVLLIDPADGRVTRQAAHPGAARPGALPCRWVQFAPDGNAFATWGLGPVVCLWDTANSTLRHALKGHAKPCRCANFSPDGRMLVTASEDRSVILWDLASGRPAATLRHPDWVFDARFSPDGRFVLTGCRDHMARLWDYASGELVCSPFEHDDEVYAVNFSRDGRWVLTCGRDGTTRAWDWRTGELLTPPWPLSGRGYQLEVTPDGRYAVVAGAMGGIEVFDLDDLLAPAAAELDCEGLRLAGELLSGRRVYEGGGTVNLTSAQWLEAWRVFRRSYPDHLRGNATGRTF